MLQLDKILLAHDLSDGAQRALLFALDLAARTGADLHVVLVCAAPNQTRSSGHEPSACLNEKREQLHRTVVTHPHYPAVDPGQVRIRTVSGADPASTLLDYAHHHGHDLIVTGARGWNGPRNGSLGTVAGQIVRLSTRPVLTVGEQGVVSAAGMSRILVPIDFSAPSTRALREAKEVARLLGASLVLLFVAEERHVFNFKNDGRPSRFDMPPDPRLIAWAEDALRQLATWVGLRPGEAEYHVAVGRPDRQIVTFARKEAIDLVVMSTHGKGSLRYFPLGSVTEAVVHGALCSVLTVRAFATSLLAEATQAQVESSYRPAQKANRVEIGAASSRQAEARVVERRAGTNSQPTAAASV